MRHYFKVGQFKKSLHCQVKYHCFAMQTLQSMPPQPLRYQLSVAAPSLAVQEPDKDATDVNLDYEGLGRGLRALREDGS